MSVMIKGKCRTIAVQDISHIKGCLIQNPGCITYALFEDTAIENISQTNRNKVIGNFTKKNKPGYKPPLITQNIKTHS